MGSPRRPGSAPRWLAASVGVTLAVALLGLLAFALGPRLAPARDGGRAGARSAAAAVDRATPGSSDTSPVAEIGRLLDHRAAAVLHRDRVAFLATVDPRSPAFLRSQGAMFDALAAVPLSSWSYLLDAQPQRRLPADRRSRYAAETYQPAVVLLRYGLRGFDPSPAPLPMYLTFVHRRAGWLLGSDRDFDGTGVRTAREPWDFGPVTVVTGRDSLVLGHPGSSAMLPQLAAEADRAVPAVTAVWGSGWARRVVLVVPADVTELTRLLAEDRDVSRLAAVATGWSTGAGPAGQRVLLNPTNFARLGRLGRRVVLTHEITHLATRAVTGTGTPTWLVEGFADYVAYRATQVPVRVAAAELTADVRRGRLPAALPASSRFDGTDTRIAQAYEEAWLACRLIAESGGPVELARFYRTAAAAGGDPPTVLTAAFRDVLGTTEATFTTRWRSYLRTQLS